MLSRQATVNCTHGEAMTQAVGLETCLMFTKKSKMYNGESLLMFARPVDTFKVMLQASRMTCCAEMQTTVEMQNTAKVRITAKV